MTHQQVIEEFRLLQKVQVKGTSRLAGNYGTVIGLREGRIASAPLIIVDLEEYAGPMVFLTYELRIIEDDQCNPNAFIDVPWAF